MKRLLINIQPTLFNYSGYILDERNIVKELTSIPYNILDIATYSLNRGIDEILLKGPKAYAEGVKQQLEKKINIPIKLYEVNE